MNFYFFILHFYLNLKYNIIYKNFIYKTNNLFLKEST